jgi:hypothetical protein
MKKNSELSPATPESVWALLQELVKAQKETDLQLKENERLMKESRANHDREMKEMRQEIGSFGHSQGSFAEEYFYNSFKKGQKNFFGEKFNMIEKNVKGASIDLIKDEYDIVLYNSDSIAIIEVVTTQELLQYCN